MGIYCRKYSPLPEDEEEYWGLSELSPEQYENRTEAMADMNQEIMDHELEARYEKYKGILKNLTIMSDVFV